MRVCVAFAKKCHDDLKYLYFMILFSEKTNYNKLILLKKLFIFIVPFFYIYFSYYIPFLFSVLFLRNLCNNTKKNTKKKWATSSDEMENTKRRDFRFWGKRNLKTHDDLWMWCYITLYICEYFNNNKPTLNSVTWQRWKKNTQFFAVQKSHCKCFLFVYHMFIYF
jgi:predicted membrane protein